MQSPFNGTTGYGFIAQEVDQVQQNHNAEWLDMVYKANPERWEVAPGKLVPVLVQGWKEQQATIKEQKLLIEQQQAAIQDLQQSIQTLVSQVSALQVQVDLLSTK